MEKIFIDTNLIIYTNDKRDKIKQVKAIKIITALIESRQGIISTQVMRNTEIVQLFILNTLIPVNTIPVSRYYIRFNFNLNL